MTIVHLTMLLLDLLVLTTQNLDIYEFDPECGLDMLHMVKMLLLTTHFFGHT